VSKMLSCLRILHHLFFELRTHVWRGKVIERKHPIFPGYIFLYGFSPQACRIVGAHGFAQTRDGVITVRNHVIDGLIKAANGDILPVVQKPIVSRFAAGDRVRIQGTHPFAGHYGRFQRLLTATQALIEIDLFGRWIYIPADERDLDIDIPRRRRRRRRRREGERALSSASVVAAAA
jgi:hypothetical protein